ncbi:MAG: hypothetical protein LBT92_04370 [Rickettsiales bacterium]|jgi:hypothetical protein|nr:hypothetical protein [Rickettsiales bacterium]
MRKLSILALAVLAPLGVFAQGRGERLKALQKACEEFNSTAAQEFRIPDCTGLSLSALQSAMDKANEAFQEYQRQQDEDEAVRERQREDGANLKAISNLRDMAALYDLFDAIYAIPRYAENPKMQEASALLDGEVPLDEARIAIYDAILSLSGGSLKCGGYFENYPFNTKTVKGSDGSVQALDIVTMKVKLEDDADKCPILLIEYNESSNTGYTVIARKDGSSQEWRHERIPMSSFPNCRYFSGDSYAAYLFDRYLARQRNFPPRFTAACLDKLKNGESF